MITETNLYRSPHLPPGTFRQVGVMHMHIDGAGYESLVNAVVRQLEVGGARVKFTAISQAVAGPQRASEPSTYASHTPGSPDAEHLEYFSTSTLQHRVDAVRTIAVVIPKIAEHDGVIIEVERVIAKIDEQGWRSIPVKDSTISGAEVGFAPAPSLPYEIHLALDFSPEANRADTAPVSLEQLLEETTAKGLIVGGWFSFCKPGKLWSFRSNAFTAAPETELQTLVTKQFELLGNYAKERHLQCRRWAIVEQVVGIWRSPFQTT
jgi:hypothetical protein